MECSIRNMKTHGVTMIKSNLSDFDSNYEEFVRNGYCLIKGVLDAQQISSLNESIMRIYRVQEDKFGRDLLSDMNELNVVRSLCGYDDRFIHEVALNQKIRPYIDKALGKYYVLHSQVATINEPQVELYQTAWHRELQYQHFTSSRPLAVQSIFCLDPFNNETGATYLIPNSHMFEEFPSREFVEKHEMQLIADPGDVLFMNSMIYHRAGVNTSKILRRLITNTYTIPIIAQQINLSKLVDKKFEDDDFMSGFLGFRWAPANSPEEWRDRHWAKQDR